MSTRAGDAPVGRRRHAGRAAVAKTHDRPPMFARRWAIALAILAYIAVLHVIFQYDISPDFAYLRYEYRSPNPIYYGYAIALAVALALVLPDRLSQPSQFIAWALFIVAIVPSLVVPQISLVLSPGESMEVAVWVAISYFPVAAFGTRRAVREVLPSFRISPASFWAGLGVLTVLLYVYVVAAVGVRWELPSLADVYGVRGEFKTEEAESSRLLSYAVPLIANVLNPLIVVRGIYTRRWIWIVAGLVGQVFIFSFTGYRSSALSPVVLVGAYLLFRRNSRPASIIMPLSVTVLAVTMWATDRFLSSIEFTSLLVRRFLITPGLLTAGYVAVFHDIDKVYLSHSFLKPFLVYPYAQEPPLLVGELFFHNPETNANANLLADGYANFGFPGMLIECLVLVVLLWAVDDGCRGLPIGICATVFVMPVLALADSGIFTTMLTHGFVAAIVACLLMPRTGWERVPRRSERS